MVCYQNDKWGLPPGSWFDPYRTVWTQPLQRLANDAEAGRALQMTSNRHKLLQNAILNGKQNNTFQPKGRP